MLAALLATNFYRAATQSIVHDEALTWQYYLAGPASNIFQHYDANNHFLATLLFRISTTLFGQSEFAMRLPTVLAGAWFYWTVFRLCARFLGNGWLFLLGCAALALNPLLLDFMVAARGYGLAMSGLFWALYQMLCWFHDGSNPAAGHVLRKRLWKAAIGCSIAVATNLTFVIPVFILAAAFCVLVVRSNAEPARGTASLPASKSRKKERRPKPEPKREPARSYAPLVHFIVPVIVLAFAFLLAAPIDLARSEDLYAGLPTAMISLRDLVNSSFAYGSSSGVLNEIERVGSNFALIFVPAIALAALAVAIRISIPMTGKSRSMAELATLLASLAVVGSAILLTGAHLVSGILYPQDRTGIYFIPLASLAALGLAQILSKRPGFQHWLGVGVAVVLLSAAAEFAAQWNVNGFLVWRYDADTKRIFSWMEAAPKPPGQIRLGVSWVLEPALNYYRQVRQASWMSPVLRDGFQGARHFYVAVPWEQRAAPRPNLKVIYRGPASGTALAVPQANQ